MSDTRTSAETRQYEIMFIVAGDKTDDTVTEVTKHVKDEIASREGKIAQEDAWGLRDFTYPIKRQQNGYYTVLNFSLPASKLNDLNKHLRLNTNVLRFLITSLPENYKFMTFEEMRAHGKKAAPATRGGGRREADAISAEGSKLHRAPRTAAPAPVTPAPRPARVATPVTAAITEEPAMAPATPAPRVRVTEKPKPAAPAMSEEDRLKELDKQLEQLIKEDEI